MNAPVKFDAAISETAALRREVAAERLKVIRYRGMARRAAWALIGLANHAERSGCDVSYWRGVAEEIEGRAR